MTTTTMPTQFELKKYAYASDLKSRALNVFIYLIDRTNKELTCFPSIATIGKNLHISISTVKRAMKELVEKGFLKKEARFSEKKNWGQTSNLYYLSIPEEKAEDDADSQSQATDDVTATEKTQEQPTAEIKHINFDAIVGERKTVSNKLDQTQTDSEMTNTASALQSDNQEELQTSQPPKSAFKAVILKSKQIAKDSIFQVKSFIFHKMNPTPVQFDTPFNLSVELYNSEKRSIGKDKIKIHLA